MSRKKKHKKKEASSWPDLFAVLAVFSLLLLPLVHYEKIMDTSLHPRLLFLLLFLIAMSLIFLKGNIFRQLETGILRAPIFWVSAGLFLITGFSLIFAINVSAGFFDLAKTFGFLVFMAYTSLILLNTPGWPLRLSKFFILGTIVSLAIGYYQYLVVLGPGFHDRGAVFQVNGWMSNVNLYANYLMMMIPLLVYATIVLSGKWRILASVVLALNLVMLVLLQTRAVYLGILVSLPAGIILLLIHYKSLHISVKARNIILFMSIGIAITLGCIYWFAPEDNIYVSRLQSIFTDRENPRLLIWQICLMMARDHPLTGVGAGNFTILVQEYYGLLDMGIFNINWLRPHNDFLWIATEKGIPGLVLFLSFFGLAFIHVWKIIHPKDDHSEKHKHEKWLALLIFMGLVSYMVNSLFDFPLERINHQVVLAILISCLVVLSYKSRVPSGAESSRHRRHCLLPTVVLLAIGVIYSVIGIRQEYYISLARKAEIEKNWEGLLVAAQKASSGWKTLDPLAVPVSFWEGFACLNLNQYEEALAHWEIARKQNPNRQYILQNLGLLYNHFERYDDTIEVMEKMQKMFPFYDLPSRLLSEAYYHRKRFHEALDLLEAIPDSLRSETSSNNIIHIRELLQAGEDPG